MQHQSTVFAATMQLHWHDTLNAQQPQHQRLTICALHAAPRINYVVAWAPADCCWLLLPAGAEAITKEVASVREAAQNEMLLDEESSPATVTDELQHLLAQLQAQEHELARINNYQRLFKVG